MAMVSRVERRQSLKIHTFSKSTPTRRSRHVTFARRFSEVRLPQSLPHISSYFLIFVAGHTRQGLKCKLCRMNVHPDCQEAVPKCQPKSRLLRRQKSASEIDARVIAGEDESKLPVLLVFWFLRKMQIRCSCQKKNSLVKSRMRSLIFRPF